MHWIFLTSAIFFEVCGTLSIKRAAMGSAYFWGSLVAVFYCISFFSLGFAVKKLDIGTAYAIWSGLGTAAITILAWFIFGESMNYLKVAAIMMIVFGVILLKIQI